MTTPPAAYLWNEDYWCEGCIVHRITDEDCEGPFSAWVDPGHPPGTDDAETELNAIARRFRVNRNSASSVRRHNFPVLLEAPPSDPHAVCSACLRFFTVPAESETAGRPAVTIEGIHRNMTTTQTAKQRHTEALLYPQDEHEQTLVTLFAELGKIADRYRDDAVMLPAVEHLGSAIIVLLNGPTGRIDQGMLDKQVRDTVERAGGNSEEL